MQRSFFVKLQQDQSIIKDMDRSLSCVKGSKKFHKTGLSRCKNLLATLMYFDDTRRFSAAFITSVLPIYHHWPFIRLCLIADGTVKAYMAADKREQFLMRSRIFRRHSKMAVTYALKWFEDVKKV